MQQVDISAIGVTSFEGPEGKFDVEVFDSADDYVKLMKWVPSIWEHDSRICSRVYGLSAFSMFLFPNNIFLLP